MALNTADYTKEQASMTRAAALVSSLVSEYYKGQMQDNLATRLTKVMELENRCHTAVSQLLAKDFPQDEVLSRDTLDTIWEQDQRLWSFSALNAAESLAYRAGKDVPALVMALREECKTQLAMIFMPGSEEMYMARNGHGVFKHKGLQEPTRLTLPNEEIPLAQAWVEVQADSLNERRSPDMQLRTEALLRRSPVQTTMQRPHASLAAKMIDPTKPELHAILFDRKELEPRFTAWELMAMELLINEAGGTVAPLQLKGGQLVDFNPYRRRPGIMAVNETLASTIIKGGHSAY